jgi:SAM-dependent methyltransferase
MLKGLIRKLIPSRHVKYDNTFFQEQWFSSWEELKLVLAKLIESHPEWKRILDFGCGPGIMIDLMADKSDEYIGCDYSADANKLYQERYGLNPERYKNSLSDPLCQQKFDVFLSFDVFEHLTDDQICTVLKNVPSIPTLFLNISRTRGIPGHINLKSDRSWIGFIEKQGYKFVVNETDQIRKLYSILRPSTQDGWNKNMFIFKKKKY